jgi:predicted nucleic acid-binding protein
LIVADSSFLVHGILKDANILGADPIVTADLGLHEVANAIWKHEHVIGDIKQGISFAQILLALIDSRAITLVTPNRRIVERAYSIADRYKVSFYDCVFVALAIETGLELRTLDREQEQILKAERL